MAGLRLIIFGLLAVSCSAHFFGYNHNHGDFTRQQRYHTPKDRINNFLSKFGVRADDQKCFTIAKRPFYMTRLMQYPCYKRMVGVPVVKSYMGPFGPMCMSYFREKVNRYFKIQTCCPGYAMDKMGKCSIRIRKNNNNNNSYFNARQQQQQQQQQTFNYKPNMMEMAAQMRKNMWQRANEAVQQRRNMMFNNFNQMRQQFRPPMRQPRFPNFMNMFNKRRDQPRPKIAFLRFNKFGQPPMPRPVQRPPMTRMVKIIKPSLFTFQRPIQQQRQQMQGRILSNRGPFNQQRPMFEFHPQMPRIPTNPLAQRIYPEQQNFPQIPGRSVDTNPYQEQEPNHMHEGFNAPEAQEANVAPNIQVDLPAQPVEMPELIVEEAPLNNQESSESCVLRLESSVKTCLKKNNIDVPDLMTAFEPFNDDTSLILCRAEGVIFDCIENELKTCLAKDNVIARDMLTETAETVRSMCELREVSVPEETQVAPGTQPEHSSTEGKGTETIPTVESVDAIPTAEKKQDGPEIIVDEQAPVENKPTESMSAASQQQAMQEAIQHEVHVQEMRMKEYLLPILIGSGVGFFVIVLILSLVVCCCCKRKMKRKMKVAKEVEKPPLKDDEIYTIGVAPPVYEVNGIPPMYYEEAKGEKISSRSSSVQGGADVAPEADATQM